MSAAEVAATVSAVEGGAAAAGADTRPQVLVRSVQPLESTSSASAWRRHLQAAAGHRVHLQAVFDKSDAQAARRLANTLRTEPSSVFPPAVFGNVTVEGVKVKTIIGGGVWAGIALGAIAFVGVLTAMIVILVVRRRRRWRPITPGSPWRRRSDTGLLGRLRGFLKRPEPRPKPSTPEPVILMSNTMRSDSQSSDDEISLRELYAVKQQAAWRPMPSARPPPPPLPRPPGSGMTRQAAAPLPPAALRPPPVAATPSRAPQQQVVLFQNPLAEIYDGEEEEVAARIQVTRPSGSASSSGSSSSSTTSAGWFKEARQKSSERGPSRLSRRQSFRK